ncbi:MAG: hypothetical protein N4A71_02570 [Carboxylicivirga sp.]|nr:hypothetical protein [Carboxylicivirga sp.]MCT4647116.1 hypothetical protein [Carboxylicivirga sp.]
MITSRNLKHKNGAAVLQSADPEKNICVGITESAGSNFDWMIEKFYHYEKNDRKGLRVTVVKKARQIWVKCDELL